MCHWHTWYAYLAVYKVIKRCYNISVIIERKYMKHFADLTEAQRAKFENDLSADLEQFFAELRSKYNMCTTCLHNAVSMMCENYVEDMEKGVSNARH